MYHKKDMKMVSFEKHIIYKLYIYPDYIKNLYVLI